MIDLGPKQTKRPSICLFVVDKRLVVVRNPSQVDCHSSARLLQWTSLQFFVWSTIQILTKGQCKQHHTNISLFKFLSHFCLVSKLIFYSRGHILFTLSLEIRNLIIIYSVPFSLYQISSTSRRNRQVYQCRPCYITKRRKKCFTLF